MREPARIVYIFLQMPQNTFLALAILQRDGAAVRPLRDARPRLGAERRSRTSSWPAAVMWVVGDLVFLAAILRDRGRAGCGARSARRGPIEAREDRERAAIREREVRLAERLARERSEG